LLKQQRELTSALPIEAKGHQFLKAGQRRITGLRHEVTATERPWNWQAHSQLSGQASSKDTRFLKEFTGAPRSAVSVRPPLRLIGILLCAALDSAAA